MPADFEIVGSTPVTTFQSNDQIAFGGNNGVAWRTMLTANQLKALATISNDLAGFRTAIGLGTAALTDSISYSNRLNPTAVKTSNYTVVANDLVPFDTTSGAITATLPSAPANGTLVCLKLVIQGGTNTVTYNCSGSDVFNKTGGVTSGTLTFVNQAVVLQYKASGAIWFVIADDLPLSQLDLRYSPLAGGSNIVTVGTLIAGATGLGFTVSLTNSTISGNLPDANLGNAARVNAANTFSVVGQTIAGTAGTGTKSPSLTITGPAHTALTASTESSGVNFDFSATKQFATGALALQREIHVQAPTYSAVGATTITEASTMEISGAPIAGTNATITNPYALVVKDILCIRQNGGAVASKEIQIKHNGTNGFVQQLSGKLILGTYANIIFNSATGTGTSPEAAFITGSGFRIRSNYVYSWPSSSDPEGAADTTLGRIAAGGVALSNPSTVSGSTELRFNALSSTSAAQDQSSIVSDWQTPTNASRAGRLTFYGYYLTTPQAALTITAQSSGSPLSVFSGTLSSPGGTFSEKFGAGASSSGTGSTAFGYNATATATYALAIGSGANSANQYTVALGGLATTTGSQSIAIGYNTSAVQFSVALGTQASTTASSCVAIGSQATAGTQGDVVFYNAGIVIAVKLNAVTTVTPTQRTIAAFQTSWTSSVEGSQIGRLTMGAYYILTYQEGIRIDAQSGGTPTITTGGPVLVGGGNGSYMRVPSMIAANLASASTAGVGALATVTDSTTTAITGLGLAVTGGGTNKVLVQSDGTNWIVL